ncbi:MAG TPA: hypothetical protein PKD64_10130 [Pirellulaceae bacterium]|nr:hypothetical protein [Pirellulaceae bacterium]
MILCIAYENPLLDEGAYAKFMDEKLAINSIERFHMMTARNSLTQLVVV